MCRPHLVSAALCLVMVRPVELLLQVAAGIHVQVLAYQPHPEVTLGDVSAWQLLHCVVLRERLTDPVTQLHA